MLSIKVMRNLFIPSAVALAASNNDQNLEGKSIICRPTDLPIYSPDMPLPQCIPEHKSSFALLLENELGKLRTIIEKVYTESQAYVNVGSQYVSQGIDSAEGAIAYLRRENNTAPKAGAIVIGGLAGFILGLRRGYFRRTLYATTGALTMSAVCYPKQASEYSRKLIDDGMKYFQIGYNFTYGDESCETKVDYGEEDVKESEVKCHCLDLCEPVDETCPDN